MQRSTLSGWTRTAVIGLSALSIASAAQAQVTISDLVTQSGGLYHYDFTVTNSSLDDVLLIDVPVPADPTAVQNAMAPVGYGISFDSGLGLVTFIEDTDPLNPQFFGTTPVSGFMFDSPFAPTSTTFTTFQATALDPNGNLVLVSGSVVPEPGGLSAYAVLTLTSGLLLRRRQLAHK